MSWDDVCEVRFRRRPGHDRSQQPRRNPLETFDAADFLIGAIMRIPDPRRHFVR